MHCLVRQKKNEKKIKLLFLFARIFSKSAKLELHSTSCVISNLLGWLTSKILRKHNLMFHFLV